VGLGLGLPIVWAGGGQRTLTAPGALGALAPFRTRSFRFLWPADLLTAWAMEMETLILGWYVLVETGSVVLLTLFGSLMYVGTLVSPVVGMLGDRLGLGRVLTGLRMVYACMAGVILVFAFIGKLHPTGQMASSRRLYAAARALPMSRCDRFGRGCGRALHVCIAAWRGPGPSRTPGYHHASSPNC